MLAGASGHTMLTAVPVVPLAVTRSSVQRTRFPAVPCAPPRTAGPAAPPDRAYTEPES